MDARLSPIYPIEKADTEAREYKVRRPHPRSRMSLSSRKNPGGVLLSHTAARASTIGSEGSKHRVRDGIGCGLFEITTGNFWVEFVAGRA